MDEILAIRPTKSDECLLFVLCRFQRTIRLGGGIKTLLYLYSSLIRLTNATQTLESLRDKPDLGVRLARSFTSLYRRLSRFRTHKYTALSSEDTPDTPDTPLHTLYPENRGLESMAELEARTPPVYKQKLPLRRAFTRNVLCTLLTHFLAAFHISTFNNLVSGYSRVLFARP